MIDPNAQTTIDAAIRHDRLYISRILNTLLACYEIGVIRQTHNYVKPLPLAAESLMRGSMWLGQALKAMGEPNPYPHSSDPTSPVIEPTADVSDSRLSHEPGDLIGTIKLLRSKIQELLEYVETRKGEPSGILFHPVSQAIISLIDAKMWLGQELSLIREAQQTPTRG